MDDPEWGMTRTGTSSHIMLTPTRMFNTYKALCGATLHGDLRPLPTRNQCENCLRVRSRKEDT